MLHTEDGFPPPSREKQYIIDIFVTLGFIYAKIAARYKGSFTLSESESEFCL